MTEPTYPAWIEAAPEPKRTLRKVRYWEVERDVYLETARSNPSLPWDKTYWVREARAANHRVLALKRQLRAMKEDTHAD